MANSFYSLSADDKRVTHVVLTANNSYGWGVLGYYAYFEIAEFVAELTSGWVRQITDVGLSKEIDDLTGNWRNLE